MPVMDSTSECFGFSKAANDSTVWLLGSSLLAVSLNTMSSNKKNIPLSFISICSQRTYLFVWALWELSVYLGGLVHSTPFLFSLHDLCVCMHCLPVCLSVCLVPQNSTRDRALKDTRTFTVSKLSSLFYCFSSLLGSLEAFVMFFYS